MKYWGGLCNEFSWVVVEAGRTGGRKNKSSEREALEAWLNCQSRLWLVDAHPAMWEMNFMAIDSAISAGMHKKAVTLSPW